MFTVDVEGEVVLEHILAVTVMVTVETGTPEHAHVFKFRFCWS